MNKNVEKYTLVIAPMGVKFGMEEIWHGGMPNFTPCVQRVAPEGRKTSKAASE